MKRYILLLIATALGGLLAAQPHTVSMASAQRFAPTPTIVVQAQQSESFYVYLNGNLVNEVPRSQVTIDRLDNGLQEVIVVLNHPARKAVAMEVYADMRGTTITVDYSHRNDQLTLTTPQSNLPQQGHKPRRHDHGTHAQEQEVTHYVVVTPPAPMIEEPQTVSDEWVSEMVALLNGQSFDSEKSSTAKGLLNNGLPFTASQIARIAGTFDFSSAQVEFLKAAYTHCIDPENYERALAVLTFSSDRESVRTYIGSLR